MTATPFAEYWSALATGDASHATHLALDEVDSGRPALDVLESLVAAGQAEVGRRWAANDWNVAQEHRATSVSEEVVAALAARAPTPTGAGSALLTCADGEWHALPSRILAAALRHAGWRVTFLGASVPADHLGPLLHELGPDVTAISCALPTRLVEARRSIERSRDAGVPVLVGGPGFGADGRWAATLGADAWAPDARAALTVLAAMPPFTTPAPPMAISATEISALRSRRSAIVERSVHRLLAGRTDIAAYDAQERRRTEEDVAHVVEFLGAAHFVGDVTLFTDFVGWLRDVLVARDVPATTLTATLAVIGDVLAEEPGGFEWAAGYLRAGTAAVGAEPGPSR